ncbi:MULTISPECIES: hypothetical protein [Bacteria][Archaea]|jgi:hypothetical protein|uniref:hypothetical protein n=1 Tax=Bacteria TaxID=2 RepID=UPI003671A7F9
MEDKTETQVVEQNAVTESVAAETPKRKTRTKKAAEKTVKPIVPKDIDPEQYVTVRNGFQGRLVYVSKHTGERFVWDQFGAEQEMELRELKNAKNSYKKFFENNWFMFDEDWIVDYLGVQRFYRNAVRIEDFDEIFQKDAKTISEIISDMSDGQKKSVAYRARVLIADGAIDSNKAITALEESLGVELVERDR